MGAAQGQSPLSAVRHQLTGIIRKPCGDDDTLSSGNSTLSNDSSKNATYRPALSMADLVVNPSKATKVAGHSDDDTDLQASIHRFRFLDDLLQQEGRFNANIAKKILGLKEFGFIGFRRVRGDGNCFYRSVGFGLLERIVDAVPSLRRYWAEQLHQKLSSVSFEASEECYPEFCRLRDGLKRLSEGGDWKVWPRVMGPTDNVGDIYEEIQPMDSRMDEALILGIRRITAQWLIEHSRDMEVGNGLTPLELATSQDYEDVVDYCNKIVLPRGHDALDIVQPAISRALNVRIRIAFLDRLETPLSFQDFAPTIPADAGEFERRIPTVFLQLRPGHYDLLYHRDKYWPDSPLLDSPSPSSAADMPSLLRSPPFFGKDTPAVSDDKPPTLDKSDQNSWIVSNEHAGQISDEQNRTIVRFRLDRQALEQEAFGLTFGRDVRDPALVTLVPAEYRQRRQAGFDSRGPLGATEVNLDKI